MQHIYIATAPRRLVEVLTLDQHGNWLTAFGNGHFLPSREELGLTACPFCEDERQSGLCKAEKGIYSIANTFSDVASIETMTMVMVRTDGQILTRVEPAQRGLTNLFITALSFSGCPKLSLMSWSWDYYVASANDKDLFYAFFSAFLTGKYLQMEEKNNGELRQEFMAEIRDLYETLNLFVGNIKKLSTQDANMNAFISLIDLTTLFQLRIDKYLGHFRSIMAKEVPLHNCPMLHNCP